MHLWFVANAANGTSRINARFEMQRVKVRKEGRDEGGVYGPPVENSATLQLGKNTHRDSSSSASGNPISLLPRRLPP